MKISKKTRLRNKADALWRDACWLKWGHRCAICGGKAEQMHHFILRRKSLALRYDIANGVPVCKSCHYKIHFSGDPIFLKEYVEKLIVKRGAFWYNYIINMLGHHETNTIQFLNDTIKRLRNFIKKYTE